MTSEDDYEKLMELSRGKMADYRYDMVSLQIPRPDLKSAKACPILKFQDLKIGQADLILIILRIRTRLSFAKQCCNDFTVEGDMLPRFRANVFR